MESIKMARNKQLSLTTKRVRPPIEQPTIPFQKCGTYKKIRILAARQISGFSFILYDPTDIFPTSHKSSIY